MIIPNTTKVSIKYQIVIPKEIRKKITISPQEKLGIFVEGEDSIILKKLPISIKKFKGDYKFSDKYLEKERLSW